MMYYFGNTFLPYGFFGPFMMIAYWIVIIGLIAWLIRVLTRASSNKKTDDALNILRNRYAKGEITKAEFEEIKKTLEK